MGSIGGYVFTTYIRIYNICQCYNFATLFVARYWYGSMTMTTCGVSLLPRDSFVICLFLMQDIIL